MAHTRRRPAAQVKRCVHAGSLDNPKPSHLLLSLRISPVGHRRLPSRRVDHRRRTRRPETASEKPRAKALQLLIESAHLGHKALSVWSRETGLIVLVLPTRQHVLGHRQVRSFRAKSGADSRRSPYPRTTPQQSTPPPAVEAARCPQYGEGGNDVLGGFDLSVVHAPYTRGVHNTCMSRLRTNIGIDHTYVQAIIERYGLRTKTEAVDLALRHLAGQT